MIFVHSSFRVASTYLWSRLRACPDTVAYREVFHEYLATLTRPQVLGYNVDEWNSKHPAAAPYFLEFLPLLRESGGVRGFDPAMSYERFVPPDGPNGDVSAEEAAYLAGLAAHAQGLGRIPVLTANRSLGRLAGIRRALPGLHVLLHRNLFQQWCSYSEQSCGGNDYFLQRAPVVLRASRHDPVLRNILNVFRPGEPAADSRNHFFCFVFLHLHLYAHAAAEADLVVDANRLAAAPEYRAEVEHALAAAGVPADLSGIRASTAYSLVRLGKPGELWEMLKVVSDPIISTAPTEAGRRFAARLLDELVEEYAHAEFYAGALRSVLVGPGSVTESRDALRRERDTLVAERDRARSEHGAMHYDREAIRAERDALRAERNRLAEERDRLRAERDALRGERDATDAACASLRREHQILEAECRDLRDARTAADADRTQLRRALDDAATERAALRTRGDDLARDRDAILASGSWRLTKPLRRFGLGRRVRRPG